MINEIKKILLRPYNEKYDEYCEYKAKFDEIKEEIIYDASEKEYKENKETIKKEYKENKDKKLFEEKMQQIMKEYKLKLEEFEKKLDKYNELKSKVSSYNVYELKKQMEKINLANNLDELNLDIEKAKELCAENGIEFRIDLDHM